MSRALNGLFVFVVALLLTGCSGFYVKVVDQYGEPVPDVSLRVGSPSNFFIVAGSRIDFYKTDRDGRFKLGSPMMVNIQFIGKNGYEFSDAAGFGSTNIYGIYNGAYSVERYVQHKNSYTNPYYILAWKRESPEPLIGHNGRSIGLAPDGSYYQVDFTTEYIHPKKVSATEPLDRIDAILLVKYAETSEVILNRQSKEMHPWELTLKVPQGGLLMTEDIIRNLAPEAGYEPEWTIRSTDFSEIDTTVVKTFYIKARNGQVYGQFEVTFRPFHGELRFEPYWLNPNGSRNLTRPKKYVYCLPRDFVPKDCSLDDYGP